MKALIPVLLIAAAGLAGCNGDETGVEFGIVHGGGFVMSSHIDYVTIWARNRGGDVVEGEWSLTTRDGGPLAAGWEVQFSVPGARLEPAGTKQERQGGTRLADWTHVLLGVSAPPQTPAGIYDLLVHFGESTMPLKLDLWFQADTVSWPGDTVTVQYMGTFANGTQFDQGQFQTQIGSGQTVPGFDLGLAGLFLGEQATLVLPPALAYGTGHPEGSRLAMFNDQTLHFDVQLVDIQDARGGQPQPGG